MERENWEAQDACTEQKLVIPCFSSLLAPSTQAVIYVFPKEIFGHHNDHVRTQPM